MGSLLKRPCTYRASGQQLCLPHRLEAFLRGKGQGRKVWAASLTEFLAAVRRLLTALDIENPEQYTLKMFRAGHATTLAEEGKSIGHILQAGEWKSAAFLSYIDEDAVDAAQIVEHVFSESDAE